MSKLVPLGVLCGHYISGHDDNAVPLLSREIRQYIEPIHALHRRANALPDSQLRVLLNSHEVMRILGAMDSSNGVELAFVTVATAKTISESSFVILAIAKTISVASFVIFESSFAVLAIANAIFESLFVMLAIAKTISAIAEMVSEYPFAISAIAMIDVAALKTTD